jgi:hypothetical protein
MLVETLVQLVGPMVLELAFREVAVPAAKKVVRRDVTQAEGGVARGGIEPVASQPLLRTIRAVQVVSAIPGRLRVDVAGLSGQTDLARRLEQEVGTLTGVLEAKASVRTGRMLVTFDPGLQCVETLTTAIDRTRASNLTPVTSQARHLAAVV